MIILHFNCYLLAITFVRDNSDKFIKLGTINNINFYQCQVIVSNHVCPAAQLLDRLYEAYVHYVQINSRNLDRVRKLKSAMTRLTSRVQKV